MKGSLGYKEFIEHTLRIAWSMTPEAPHMPQASAVVGISISPLAVGVPLLEFPGVVRSKFPGAGRCRRWCQLGAGRVGSGISKKGAGGLVVAPRAP